MSTAKVDYIAISAPNLKIELGVIESQASTTCWYGIGRSNIASVQVNGRHVVPGSAPRTIPLSIGTLRLNSIQIGRGYVVQQAVALDTVFGSIVIAEAEVSVYNNPCAH